MRGQRLGVGNPTSELGEQPEYEQDDHSHQQTLYAELAAVVAFGPVGYRADQRSKKKTSRRLFQ